MTTISSELESALSLMESTVDKVKLLKKAITDRNIERVMELTDDNMANQYDVLHTLAGCTDPEIMDHILKFKPNLNQEKYAEGPNRTRLLSVAIENDNLYAVQKFLEHDADPNKYNRLNGLSILCIAIEKKNPTIVQALLDGGAKIDQPLANGKPHLRIRRTEKNITDNLLNTIYLPNVLAFDHAIDISDEIADIIKKHADKIGCENYATSLDRLEELDEKMDKKEEELLQKLDKEKFGESILPERTDKETENSYKSILPKTLVKPQATESQKLSATEMPEHTPSDVDPSLHKAALEGRYDSVLEILSNGANVNEKDSSQNTALHYAAAGGHKEIVQLLVNNSGDLNATNSLGKKPYHLAQQVNRELYMDMITGSLLNNTDHIPRITPSLSQARSSEDRSSRTASLGRKPSGHSR